MQAERISEADLKRLKDATEDANRFAAQISSLNVMLAQARQRQDLLVELFRERYELGEKDQIRFEDGAIVRAPKAA